MAPEAVLKEAANSELRRLFAQNESSNRADAQVGDTVLFYKASSRKGTQRRRGQATILDIDEAGVTVKYPRRRGTVRGQWR